MLSASLPLSFLLADDSIKAHQNACVCPHLHRTASRQYTILIHCAVRRRVTTLSGAASAPSPPGIISMLYSVRRFCIDVPSIPFQIWLVCFGILPIRNITSVWPIYTYQSRFQDGYWGQWKRARYKDARIQSYLRRYSKKWNYLFPAAHWSLCILNIHSRTARVNVDFRLSSGHHARFSLSELVA